MNKWFDEFLSSVGDRNREKGLISPTDKTDKNTPTPLNESNSLLEGTDRTDKTLEDGGSPAVLDFDSSLRGFEDMNVALRIKSDEHGTVWLISNESCRRYVDTKDPLYMASEARLIVRLLPAELKLLHGFKKVFGGRIDPEGKHQ